MTIIIQSWIKAGVITFVIVFIYATLAHYIIEWIKKLREKKKPPTITTPKKKEDEEKDWREKCYTQSSNC